MSIEKLNKNIAEIRSNIENLSILKDEVLTNRENPLFTKCLALNEYLLKLSTTMSEIESILLSSDSNLSTYLEFRKRMKKCTEVSFHPTYDDGIIEE